MFIVRFLLGSFLLFLNKVFSARPLPSVLARSSYEQKQFDDPCKFLKIYQFTSCPFCIKVRRAVIRMGLNIEYRQCESGEENYKYREELIREGGVLQVPCLRIEENGAVRWLY